MEVTRTPIDGDDLRVRQLKAFGTFALIEIIVFIALLMAAFVYVWRRGALEWR